jgi:hypothetical protein
MMRCANWAAWLLWGATVFCWPGAGQVAWAQDDDEEEEAAPNVVQRRMMMMNEVNFDQWVFGNLGNSTNAAGLRSKLDSLLTLHLDEIEQACRLTPLQQKKLLLAGRGDIKRFFDRVDELRRKFEKIKDQQNALGMFWPEIQPLQASVNAGLFDDDSIFSKSLRATLSPEQAAQRDKIVRDRLMYRYWARVDLAMELLNNSVGFTSDQRERLVKALAEGARPPRRLGQNDYYFVLYQLAMLPQAKVKPIFDDLQWRLLSRQLDQARGMEWWLKQNGFLLDEAPAPGARDKAGAAAAKSK